MTASALHDARESRMGLSNTAVVLVWMISSVKNDDQRSGQISSDPQPNTRHNLFVFQSTRLSQRFLVSFYKYDDYYGRKIKQILISNISMDPSKTRIANTVLIAC